MGESEAVLTKRGEGRIAMHMLVAWLNFQDNLESVSALQTTEQCVYGWLMDPGVVWPITNPLTHSIRPWLETELTRCFIKGRVVLELLPVSLIRLVPSIWSETTVEPELQDSIGSGKACPLILLCHMADIPPSPDLI